MKRLFFIAFLFVFSYLGYAQAYKNSLGARIALSPGITYKALFSSGPSRSLGASGIEVMALYRYSGVSLVGLYELQMELGHNLYWFIGGGLIAGYYPGDEFYSDFYTNYSKYNANNYSKTYVVGTGVSAIFGIEIKLGKLPLMLGADFRPVMDIYFEDGMKFGGPGFLDAGGFIRYVFK